MLITQGGLASGVAKLGNEITKVRKNHVLFKKNKSNVFYWKRNVVVFQNKFNIYHPLSFFVDLWNDLKYLKYFLFVYW